MHLGEAIQAAKPKRVTRGSISYIRRMERHPGIATRPFRSRTRSPFLEPAFDRSIYPEILRGSSPSVSVVELKRSRMSDASSLRNRCDLSKILQHYPFRWMVWPLEWGKGGRQEREHRGRHEKASDSDNTMSIQETRRTRLFTEKKICCRNRNP